MLLDPTLPLFPVESEITPRKGEVVLDSVSQTTVHVGMESLGTFVPMQNCDWWSLRCCIPSLLPGTAWAGPYLEEKGLNNIPESDQ